MDSSQRRRHDRNSPELQRLAEAQSTLDDARRNAKWRRKCKKLQSAAHAVQAAALAAHDAGISWTEIGDVLNIQRAVSDVNSTPTQPVSAAENGRHRVQHVAEATLHIFPETRQWVAG